MMIILKNFIVKTQTKLCRNTTLNPVLRFMETQTGIDRGNAFYLYGCSLQEGYERPLYAQDAEDSLNYVIDFMDRGYNFSEIIRHSHQQLNYIISAESFASMFSGMLNNPKMNSAARTIIPQIDNIGMFNHENFELNTNYKERYNLYAKMQVDSPEPYLSENLTHNHTTSSQSPIPSGDSTDTSSNATLSDNSSTYSNSDGEYKITVPNTHPDNSTGFVPNSKNFTSG